MHTVGRRSIRWRARRRHHSDRVARRRDDAIDGADRAAVAVDHHAHENAAEIGRPQHVGRALAQRRRQGIEAGRPHDAVMDVVRRQKTGHGKRRWYRKRRRFCPARRRGEQKDNTRRARRPPILLPSRTSPCPRGSTKTGARGNQISTEIRAVLWGTR